jgi:hypothetical protein
MWGWIGESYCEENGALGENISKYNEVKNALRKAG